NWIPPYQVRGRLSQARNDIRVVILFFLLITVHSSLFTVSYAESPKRIISLAPSVTEILFAAGLGDKIVGVTNFCDYPPEAKQKLKIGGMSNPSLETVVSLKPDIVVMTTDGNPEEFKQRLHSMKIKTLVFESLTLQELPEGIRKMGSALDEKERFDALASSIEGAINRFKVRSMETNPLLPPFAKGGRGGIAESQSLNAEFKKKVLFIIWPEPLIVAGSTTAINDAIDLLGGINIAGKTKGRYPKFSIEEIIRQSPDIIFFGRGKGMDEISGKLLKRLSSVPAVKNKKVFYVSDNLFRLGPRVIKGIEELEVYLQRKP
ncbi:MAG: cobalamin-binding protein, partial [Nitrospirota bacterium]